LPTTVNLKKTFAQAQGLSITVSYSYIDPILNSATIRAVMGVKFASPTGGASPTWNTVTLMSGPVAVTVTPLAIDSLFWSSPSDFADNGVPLLTSSLPTNWSLYDINMLSAFGESVTLFNA
jgi:hypothetical protein